MPDICWSSLTGTSTFSNSFCDFVFEMSLSQLVMEATHIKGNILDLVLTNVENSICELSIDTSHPLVHSDHHSITFRICSVLFCLIQKVLQKDIILRQTLTVCVIIYLTSTLKAASILMMWNPFGLLSNLQF